MDKTKYLVVAGLLLMAVSCRSLLKTEPAPQAAAPSNTKVEAVPAPSAEPATNGYEKAAMANEDVIHIREKVNGDITSEKALAMRLDALSRDLARKVTGKNPTMVVATFVDMDRLNRSNTFGRYVSENLMGHMARLGFNVIEHRAAKRLMPQPNVGAHALSEEPAEMMNAWKADSVLLGTYKRSGNTVMVHARLVSASSQKVLSSADMEMTFDKDDAMAKDLFDNGLERVGRVNNPHEGWVK